MRPVLTLSMLIACACSTRHPQPLCVIDPAALPETWRPPNQASSKAFSNTIPWSPQEAADAKRASQIGLTELTDYFSSNPSAVIELGDDAVEPFLDTAYGNTPDIQAAARQQARKILAPLLARRLAPRTTPPNCKEFWPLLTLTVYAHSLLPPDDARTQAITSLTNSAFHSCGSLKGAMGYDYREKLKSQTLSIDEAWDLVMWSITLTHAQLVPNLNLPREALDLPRQVWPVLQHYPLSGAKNFYDAAYLATHIAYIPTGYGRHQIYIQDAPELYRFLRENFYRVLQKGELDLVAEFADLFREYGCTEEDDLQLRDGTRYLLKLFHQAGDRWMAYREPNEKRDIDDYDAIHKAWTGIGGVRPRTLEPASPGTYGGVIRQWLMTKP